MLANLNSTPLTLLFLFFLKISAQETLPAFSRWSQVAFLRKESVNRLLRLKSQLGPGKRDSASVLSLDPAFLLGSAWVLGRLAYASRWPSKAVSVFSGSGLSSQRGCPSAWCYSPSISTKRAIFYQTPDIFIITFKYYINYYYKG